MVLGPTEGKFVQIKNQKANKKVKALVMATWLSVTAKKGLDVVLPSSGEILHICFIKAKIM